MMYGKAVSTAARSIVDARKISNIPDSLLVVVAGVIGEIYNVGHSRVFSDIESAIAMIEGSVE